VRRSVWAGVAYVVAACAFTWPLVRHPFALFGAADSTGDPSLNLWTLIWDLQTLSAHPTWFLTGRVFDAPTFFPAHHTLAYADHLLLQAILVWPVYAVTHDPVFCYNVLLLASLAAAGFAMHLLVRGLTGHEGAAYTAGLIFGFAPYHFTHLTHIQLQALYFLPLTLLFLHRVFAAGRPTDVVALGVVMGLQAISSAYYGVIGAIGIGCAAIALAVATRRLGDWRLLLRGVAAAGIALAVALPWSIAYLQVEREAAAGRNLYEASHGSAVLASYVQAPATNVLYGRTGWLVPAPSAALPRKDGPEQGLFPGFLAMLLAIGGAVAAPRHLRKAAIVYGALTVAGVVLSLGPDGVRPLYAVLYRSMVGMSAIRAAARFSVLALCGMAVLSAIAICGLDLRFPRARRTILAAALVAIATEQSNGAITFPAAPALTSNAGRWLRAQPGSRAAVCVPMGFETAANTRCMLQALEHGRPIANGYGGLRPPFFPALVDAVRALPSPDTLLTLHSIGVEWIISDGPIEPDPKLRDALVERARFSDQWVYQLVWSPAIESTIDDAVLEPPPEPGPPSFGIGESATYRLRWIGGPVNLAAAEGTISVEAPRGGAAFRFVVSAGTASWMSNFFDATVQVETTATDRLLPIETHEHFVEGRRTQDRQFAFDTNRREVRMTTGGTTVTLPLARDARDPISALFYVRTLPFQTGTHVVVPLTDNGRRSQLDVTVGAIETVVVDGHSWQAWKVAPRITGRVERQQPLDITAWLSADARKVPVVFEVSAAFGTVRAELVGYSEGRP
jgi:uncharacterized protein DUF3108